MSERFLVTGAGGCLGAWVVRRLLDEGAGVVALDVAGASAHRLRQLLADDELAALVRVECDIAERGAVRDVLRSHAVTNVVHLAGLQVPFCRADPARGAAVNVLGTINVFEAVKGAGGIRGPIAYASSVAAFAGDDDGRDPRGAPATHYGVYKRANEGTGAVYARDDGIASIGLRPYVVYGVGRDQGVTSSPTAAMLAAARAEPGLITYAGRVHMQLADDVAAAFIAAARAPFTAAAALNLGGAEVEVAEIVAAIELAAPEAAGTIRMEGAELPFPPRLDASAFAGVVGSDEPFTPFAEGVARTVIAFRDLVARDRLVLP